MTHPQDESKITQVQCKNNCKSHASPIRGSTGEQTQRNLFYTQQWNDAIECNDGSQPSRLFGENCRWLEKQKFEYTLHHPEQKI